MVQPLDLRQTGARVLDAKLDAERAQLAAHFEQQIKILDRGTLGQFQTQLARGRGLGEDGFPQPGNKATVLQGDLRDVHASRFTVAQHCLQRQLHGQQIGIRGQPAACGQWQPA